MAQYPDISAINPNDPNVDIDAQFDPVIIDITHQFPQKPGLHDSLESEAFLKYASDLVGQTVPDKPACYFGRRNAADPPS